MGCSPSKNTVESPSKCSKKGTSSFDKAIRRRFAMQINRSLKATDGSYIAAIFSAYGVVRKHVPFKALGTKNSLPNSSQEEMYSTSTRSMAVKSDYNLHANFSAHTVLGVPVKGASKMLEAQKSTESTTENLETINILELMDRFDKEEVSANVESWQANQGLPILSIPVHKNEHSTVGSIKPSEEEQLPKSLAANKSARRPRPKSFSLFGRANSIEDANAALLARTRRTQLPLQSSIPKSFLVISSIRTTEDVDAVLSAREGSTPSPSKSLREGWHQEEDASGERRSPLENTSNTILDLETNAQNGNIDICLLPCEPPKSSIDGDDLLMPNSGNLARALSFKYMFRHSSSKKQNSSTNACYVKTAESNPPICRSDSLVFSTALLFYDGEGDSSPPSPQLSPFSTYSPKASDDSTNVICETSISEALLSQCEDEPPVFDPEMVDFFENAMRRLSEEEWNAVRGMEDSPRNFQRLVKVLKKSSSNSLCIRKERESDPCFFTTMKANKKAEISTNYHLEPESKPERLFVEKKWAFMRQNSLESGKVFSMTKGQDDKDTAGVVFYSSTTRDNLKAYDDCNRVRSILQSIVGISYDERSISELDEYEKELRNALNLSVLIVPTLYVQGKYLVGIESILQLYKMGRLDFMLKEAVAQGSRLIDCTVCEGRCKLIRGGGEVLCRQCGSSGHNAHPVKSDCGAGM